ncbi:hypothetical protein HID58_055613 [Brassica napus]|uniref:Uncharacterized protein n=1 Tax=Brassica napus TaxID=3708 RepID=A0ABQ8AKU9_BRANA|nr:hypothetical protein HID58_055613 [Brassica napus]
MCHRGPAPGRQISLTTALRIRDQKFLLPSGAKDHLQKISTDISDLHQLTYESYHPSTCKARILNLPR